jgi:hypothetical protein
VPIVVQNHILLASESFLHWAAGIIIFQKGQASSNVTQDAPLPSETPADILHLTKSKGGRENLRQCYWLDRRGLGHASFSSPKAQRKDSKWIHVLPNFSLLGYYYEPS